MSTERGAKTLKVPPPIVYAASFLCGLGLHALTDDSIPGRPETAWLGGVLIAVGLGLGAGAVKTFIRARTTIIPHHRVAELVTSGPYRFSRNPMYTGLMLVCLGGALIAGTWWPFVTLIPALVIVRMTVIAPEERYLTEAFGERYTAYTNGVRRWL